MSEGAEIPLSSDAASGSRERSEASMNYSAQMVDLDRSDEKWPAWKVTVFVIGFCGSFWAGLAFLLGRLLG